MNYKSIFAVLVLFLVFASVGCQDSKESPRQVMAGAKANGTEQADTVSSLVGVNDRNGEKDESHIVIVYYFHRTFRCPSCLAIENLSQEAIQSIYGPLLGDGTLKWRVINMDEPGGEKLVKDFNLETSSLVITDVRNGEQVRWKKLEDVWELKDRRGTFMKYVQDEVGSYLAGDL